MKKVAITLILNLVVILSFAQITLTNTDMPSVNDTIRFSETNNIQGLDPLLTGSNFSWDFSTLTSTTQRIDTFVSVTSTPLAYQFFFNNQFLYPDHKASYSMRGVDIGVPQVSVTEVFNFIKNSSSAYDNVGFGANINGIPSSTRNIPVDREYEFPMDYNDNHISNSEFTITVPSLGHYGQTLERIDTVDGWGSLTLPNGTYDVLRVKSILNKVDTIYVDQFLFGTTTPRAEEVEYKWLATGKSLPMLKIITIAGAVTQIEYQDDVLITTTIEEINRINNVTVFPNPTKNHLIIAFKATVSGNLTINLKDVLGKGVGEIYNSKIIEGNNKVLIDLMQYSINQGIYFVELLVDEKQYYTEKIVVTD